MTPSSDWAGRLASRGAVAAPSHRGFGSQLIEMSVQRQLKGALTHDWSGGGLTAVLVVPADHLAR